MVSVVARQMELERVRALDSRVKGDPPLVATPPNSMCELCVIIPVRNERDRLPATLTSLAAQADLDRSPVDRRRFEIIILANNCTDESAEIARDFAQQHPDLALHVAETTFPPDQAYVGRARQLLMDEGYRRLVSLGRERGVIASTDGDTRATPTWVAATLSEIERGADAVGGRYLMHSSDLAALDPGTRGYYLRDIGYRFLVTRLESLIDPQPHDQWPRHFQHFGPSTAVTVEAYRRAGGMEPLRRIEDVGFALALERADTRIRHSLAVRLYASGRLTNRTGAGFASQLREWARMAGDGEPWCVPTAVEREARARLRRALRETWHAAQASHPPAHGTVRQLGHEFGIDGDWLYPAILEAPTFGILKQQVEAWQLEHGWFERWPGKDVRQVIWDLRVRVRELEANGSDE